MEQERIVFQTKRDFNIIIITAIVSSFLLFPIILDDLKNHDLFYAFRGLVFLCFAIWATTTQEKQITLYESYLKLDSKSNVFFKPKEFKYADIKQILVSYKSWRPTFVPGINIKYFKDGKEYEKGFTVDVKRRSIEYPELLKHLKELGVYAYEVENI